VVSSVDGGGLIGIHDGARPFLTVDLWQSCLVAASAVGGAVPVLPAGPLYRRVGNRFTPLGGDVFRAQTPQVFRAEGLVASFRESTEPGPDTVETVMRHGNLAITTVLGDHRNIKITFPADVDRASELAKSWRDGRWLTLV
jgi:2-C-methyl-D-erythritol 4-phosphate cytidylyltransferase